VDNIIVPSLGMFLSCIRVKSKETQEGYFKIYNVTELKIFALTGIFCYSGCRIRGDIPVQEDGDVEA
jgi:hypothetical protein